MKEPLTFKLALFLVTPIEKTLCIQGSDDYTVNNMNDLIQYRVLDTADVGRKAVSNGDTRAGCRVQSQVGNGQPPSVGRQGA